MIAACVLYVVASGVDDRASIQTALDTCNDVRLSGEYHIATPPEPRTRGMLELRGHLSGPATIVYTGDTSHQDWYGIWIRASGASVVDISIDTTALTNTQEQTHAIEADGRGGPLVNIEIAYVNINHPAGDGVDLVGYEPSQTLTNVHVHHTTFERAGRSGVTFFGGCHQCEFDHNLSIDVSDQQYDGEGKGGGSHGVKIHHNYGRHGVHFQSGLSIQIQASTEVDIYSNDFDQGIYIGGCTNCTVHDMTIHQAIASSFGVLHIVKTGDVKVWNVDLTREFTADKAAVFYSGWAINAPVSVEVSDSRFTQYTPTQVIASVGTESISFEDVQVMYLGPPIARTYGISVEGGPLPSGKRSSLSIHNTQVDQGIRVSGEKAGVGTIDVERSEGSLMCENTSGILGPLTYVSNNMINNCRLP